jgi:isoquinoline 1-oxidoreductase subunit beta
MPKQTTSGTSRREFLQLGTSGLLLLCIEPTIALTASRPTALPRPIDAWIQVAPSGRFTLSVARAEMGQGVLTSLSRLLAEELDVAWEQVDVQQASVDPERYDHLTVGSLSIRTLYLPLRQAGAVTRDLLLRAAAKAWNVSPEACSTKRGVIYGPNGRTAKYHQVIDRIGDLAPSSEVKLKRPGEFALIGRPAVRIECGSKVNGSARYGIDVVRPNMLHATILRCPSLGQRLDSLDQAAASAMRGVHAIFPIPPVMGDAFTRGGVAVVARDSWTALKARRLLKPVWSAAPDVELESEAIGSALRETANSQTSIIRTRGDPVWLVSKTRRGLTAQFELPFLAHATMEPMNATVHVQPERVDAWLPTQNAADAREAIARILNRSASSVTVSQTLLGGGFGRRDATDFAVEATQISAQVAAPVKLLWTREDDLQFDRYRPAAVHVVQASLDSNASLEAWVDKMSSISIDAFLTPSQVRSGEGSEGDGARAIPYDVGAFQFEYQRLDVPVPVGWWRSVSDSINAFVVECFIDELACLATEDPLRFRLRHLRNGSAGPEGFEPARLRRVLISVAEQSRWDRAQEHGQALGLACWYARGSYIATVAQVSTRGRDIAVQQLWAAVDCGTVVNPLGVDAQIGGALQQGCSAALYERISLKSGSVEQKNFDGYRVLRIDASPTTHVHVLPSNAPPTGIGEIGVPPVAPCIANALFRLTGARFRSLPFDLTRVSL